MISGLPNWGESVYRAGVSARLLPAGFCGTILQPALLVHCALFTYPLYLGAGNLAHGLM